jgi:hypothetical protein
MNRRAHNRSDCWRRQYRYQLARVELEEAIKASIRWHICHQGPLLDYMERKWSKPKMIHTTKGNHHE